MNNYEQETIVLMLPLSPSVNDSYGITIKSGFPIKYLKKKAKDYFLIVNNYIKINNFDLQINIPLKVEIIINFATNHRNDLDNRVKSLLDSLTMANVWADDSLINDLHIIRGTVKKPGSIIIKISEYINDY